MDKECYKDKICYMIDKLIGIQQLDIFNSKNREFSLQTIFDIVGFFAPWLMFFATILLLRNREKYLDYFIIGFILNNILNSLLKYTLKEPRPTKDWELLQIGITHKVRFGFDQYGMPSGHAQDCGYILLFVALVLHDPLIVGIYSVLTLICMYQRYLYQNHSIKQVVAGLFVGLGFGYLMYYVATKKLVGNTKRRPDDDGPQ
jgi:membrane-associated phospholipid phosphatase